jgi:hypothetical protein
MYDQNRGPLLPNGPKLSPTEIGFFIMKNIENSPFKLDTELYDNKYRKLATVITLRLHRYLFTVLFYFIFLLLSHSIILFSSYQDFSIIGAA